MSEAGKQRTEQLIKGANNIADAIRDELIGRGCHKEDLKIQWDPDVRFLTARTSPAIQVQIAEGKLVIVTFSRDELEDSSDRLVRQSVVQKINLVTEKLLGPPK